MIPEKYLFIQWCYPTRSKPAKLEPVYRHFKTIEECYQWVKYSQAVDVYGLVPLNMVKFLEDAAAYNDNKDADKELAEYQRLKAKFEGK